MHLASQWRLNNYLIRFCLLLEDHPALLEDHCPVLEHCHVSTPAPHPATDCQNRTTTSHECLCWVTACEEHSAVINLFLTIYNSVEFPSHSTRFSEPSPAATMSSPAPTIYHLAPSLVNQIEWTMGWINSERYKTFWYASGCCPPQCNQP